MNKSTFKFGYTKHENTGSKTIEPNMKLKLHIVKPHQENAVTEKSQLEDDSPSKVMGLAKRKTVEALKYYEGL